MLKNVLKHNQLQNGVHEFIFLTNERHAIDYFFATLGAVFECSPKDREICYIIDWSQSGVPSLNYMFLKTREWGQKYRHVAPGRCIVIFDQKGFMPIGKALSMLIMDDARGKVEIMMEHIDKRDEAVKWLLNKDTGEILAKA